MPNKERYWKNKEYYAKYSQDHKDEISLYNQEYYQKNRERILKKKLAKKICPQCGITYVKEWYHKNRNQTHREWLEKNT
jgi:hypothetical protein